ncbi:MAG: hypothetical protein RLZ40_518, partial [Actinomycetota bacterium]
MSVRGESDGAAPTGAKRFVVLCPHFAPDIAPTGKVMTSLVREWAALGHEIHVVTSLPWYREHRVEPAWRGRLVRRERTPWGSVTRINPFASKSKANLVARAAAFVLFSLVIDRIGYKTAMWFGFVCHMVSLVMTVNATSYDGLYWANFVVALGNGTVEAYINPVVATQFRNDKSRWLNILHAGWPGGMVVAGLLALSLPESMAWQTKMWLLALPAVAYALVLAAQEFPVNERVAAGGSYGDMLKEVGALGAFIIVWLIAVELARSAAGSASPLMHGTIVAAVAAAGMFAITRSLGRPLFVLMLLLMVPLATTELGVDSWVSALMTPILGANGLYVLLYTS